MCTPWHPQTNKLFTNVFLDLQRFVYCCLVAQTNILMRAAWPSSKCWPVTHWLITASSWLYMCWSNSTQLIWLKTMFKSFLIAYGIVHSRHTQVSILRLTGECRVIHNSPNWWKILTKQNNGCKFSNHWGQRHSQGLTMHSNLTINKITGPQLNFQTKKNLQTLEFHRVQLFLHLQFLSSFIFSKQL